jgi:hypothetical protein
MSNHHRELLLSASPAMVYEALVTQQGLRSWWTQACEVPRAVDGRASFHFNKIRKVMRIDSLVAEREERWHVVEALIDESRLQRRDTSVQMFRRLQFWLEPISGQSA